MTLEVRTSSSPRGSAGFTILEILIALVVLAVSLLGVLGLLITTTKVAGGVVEDAFAATLARSVYESARLAARERPFAVIEGTSTVRGFVMNERGMSNRVPAPGEVPAPATTFVPPALPTSPTDTTGLTALRQSDFAIFLPTRPTTGLDSTFVFPRPTGAADGNTNKRDDVLTPPVPNARGVSVNLDVRRVYALSHVPDAPLITGDVPVSREAADQYSYALVVRLARVPTLLDPSGTPPDWAGLNFVPNTLDTSDGLYLLEVHVFRNFDPDPVGLQHLPVAKGRFAGLLAVGP